MINLNKKNQFVLNLISNSFYSTKIEIYMSVKTISDDFDPFDGSIGGEEAVEVFFRSGVGQVAHVDVHFCLF